MKKLIAVLALMFVLSFIVFPINATETRQVWYFDWEGMHVRIYAPHQAYPGDTMTIRIVVEAREEDLQNTTLHFRIYGCKSEGYLSWYTRRFYALDNVDLPLGTVEDQYFDVDIPESVDPGLLYSQTSCSWKVLRESSWQEQSIDGVFRVTYLKNEPYEDLQVAYNQLLANYSALQTDYNQLLADYNSLQTNYDYLENSHNDLQANYSILEGNYSTLLTNYDKLLVDHNLLQSSFNSLQNDYDNLQTNYGSLNSTYHSLLSDYSSLQASFNELKSKYEFAGEMANALNLMYVFIETTVIFIATTIYFVLKKPKPKKQT